MTARTSPGRCRVQLDRAASALAVALRCAGSFPPGTEAAIGAALVQVRHAAALVRLDVRSVAGKVAADTRARHRADMQRQRAAVDEAVGRMERAVGAVLV